MGSCWPNFSGLVSIFIEISCVIEQLWKWFSVHGIVVAPICHIQLLDTNRVPEHYSLKILTTGIINVPIRILSEESSSDLL